MRIAGGMTAMKVAGPCPIQGIVLSITLAALVPTVAAAGEASLRERLATASPERGQKSFRVCSACHTIEAGAAHGVGPNPWAVVGRTVASEEGFDRYTSALKSFGGVWSPERLDRFLRQPMAEVEGTAMVFPGVPNDADRTDLISWLNLHSPSPMGLVSKGISPEGGASVAGTADADAVEAMAPRTAQTPNLGVLVARDGAEETHAYCTACHSERIVAQQGLTRSDWEELLEQMVEENGMNPIEEPDLGRILAYLAAHYGPDRPNFPRP